MIIIYRKIKIKDSLIKKIELLVRKFIIKILTNNSSPILLKEDERLLLPENPKILLLRQDRLGDLLISIPFLKSLKNNLSNSNISILLSPKNKSAHRFIENIISNFLVYEKNLFELIKLIRNIRRSRFDVVIDLLDNSSTTSSLLLKLSGIRIRLGFNKENSNYYSHIVSMPDKSKIHPAERLLYLLLPMGISIDKSLKENTSINIPEIYNQQAEKIFKTLTNKKFKLAINIAGSSFSKFWGTKKYIEFSNLINQKYPEIEIILFSTKEYEKISEEISNKTNSKIALITYELCLYAAMLNLCDIILSPDTAAIHFASALNKPCIGLYKIPDNMNTQVPWTAYKANMSVITTNKESLSEISTQEVFSAFEILLKTKFEL